MQIQTTQSDVVHFQIDLVNLVAVKLMKAIFFP